jgi:hypothetical protein
MIERLLLITCAAYLVAAFPAYRKTIPATTTGVGVTPARRTLTILDTMTAMRVTPTHQH